MASSRAAKLVALNVVGISVPQAHFTSSDFTNLLPDAATLFGSNNIHVQNHSYGVAIENYYGNEAYAYDQHVHQNPTLVHVFSAGNMGGSDPPAAPNTASVLVNDIDSWLEVGATVIQPWVLNAFPHPDSIMATPKRKTDHLNNIEYITLSNPPEGSYQLVLKTGNLSNAEQKVSVAYGLSEQKKFNWDFPISTDIAEGEKKIYWCGKHCLIKWAISTGKSTKAIGN